MKRKEKGQKFSLEAKKLINGYLEVVQRTLVEGQASQAVTDEITEELREHILQAYWKETRSDYVKEEELQEILDTMGNPREIASEYLLDRQTTSKQTVSLSSKVVGSFSAITSMKPENRLTLLFAFPIIFTISAYTVLIFFFGVLGDMWIFLITLSDIFLLIPLVWYFFWWKKSENLDKWYIITPGRIKVYLIVNALLLVLGGLILPFLRGSKTNLRLEDTITLTGRFIEIRGVDKVEFWIKEYFIIQANIIQFSLMILFLIAASKSSISWKQLGVRFELLDVKIPVNIDDTGCIRILTTNYSTMTFSQIRMEILERSPDLEVAIKPSVRSVFEPKDAVTWIIEFTPKNIGLTTFGRIALQLDEKMYGYSPKYYFYAQEKSELPELDVDPSSQIILVNYPISIDLRVNCGICRKSFDPSDLVLFCTLCGSLFHKKHLQEWLKGHNNCPNCTKLIKVSGTEYTYSQLVHERLKQLKSESQDLKIILENFEQAEQKIMQTTPEVQEKVP